MSRIRTKKIHAKCNRAKNFHPVFLVPFLVRVRDRVWGLSSHHNKIADPAPWPFDNAHQSNFSAFAIEIYKYILFWSPSNEVFHYTVNWFKHTNNWKSRDGKPSISTVSTRQRTIKNSLKNLTSPNLINGMLLMRRWSENISYCTSITTKWAFR